MPVSALLLALAAAVLHAGWNLLLARARDVEAATAVALAAGVLCFAPVAALAWRAEAAVIPYLAVTSLLQLLYFLLLAAAYARAELSLVYPIARGAAPVLVLAAGALLLGQDPTAAQTAGVAAVAAGVVLVRGVRGRAHLGDVLLALAIACCIAAYTLLDQRGVRHASPVVFQELSMIPAALAFLALVARRGGRARLRRAAGAGPVAAGIASFSAYVLVLAALARAPAAPVAAVRESSVLLAAALAVPLLGERVGPARLAGAALVVAGVALVGS